MTQQRLFWGTSLFRKRQCNRNRPRSSLTDWLTGKMFAKVCIGHKPRRPFVCTFKTGLSRAGVFCLGTGRFLFGSQKMVFFLIPLSQYDCNASDNIITCAQYLGLIHYWYSHYELSVLLFLLVVTLFFNAENRVLRLYSVYSLFLENLEKSTKCAKQYFQPSTDFVPI